MAYDRITVDPMRILAALELAAIAMQERGLPLAPAA